MKNRVLRILLMASAIGVFALPQTARGADYYWIGGTFGNWEDGNNWSLAPGGDAAEAYPQSASAAFYRLVATPTAEVKQERTYEE